MPRNIRCDAKPAGRVFLILTSTPSGSGPRSPVFFLKSCDREGLCHLGTLTLRHFATSTDFSGTSGTPRPAPATHPLPGLLSVGEAGVGDQWHAWAAPAFYPRPQPLSVGGAGVLGAKTSSRCQICCRTRLLPPRRPNGTEKMEKDSPDGPVAGPGRADASPGRVPAPPSSIQPAARLSTPPPFPMARPE
jgi:hypothetical protein